uniref:Uncharacterized protein n=1 Tax=Anguilla anguilla TaxID=7936 RepID=A0A0E9T8W3_ANGAN
MTGKVLLCISPPAVHSDINPVALYAVVFRTGQVTCPPATKAKNKVSTVS